MGCAKSTDRPCSDKELILKIHQAIKSYTPDLLEAVINQIKSQLNPSINLNSAIIEYKDLKLTPLSFALWEGNLDSFKILYENLNLSLTDMESNLSDYNFTALSLICERNYADLLQYYIPIYLKNAEVLTKETCGPKSGLKKSSAQGNRKTQKSPTHIACEAGHISTLLVVFNYSKTADSVPDCLDIHYQDEETGENCVLIACRKGNYLMLKFLKDVVRADFDVRSAKGEDAIESLLLGYTLHPSSSYFDCLVFLVDKVGVKASKKYDEKLILAQDRRTEEYIRNRLEKNFGNIKGSFEASYERFDDELSSFRQFKNRSTFNISNKFQGHLSNISNIEVTNDSSSFMHSQI